MHRSLLVNQESDAMRTARELRVQANECLELANRTSDLFAKETLKELAHGLNRKARQTERRERDLAAFSNLECSQDRVGCMARRATCRVVFKTEPKECAMKLTSTQLERTLSQFKAEAIPEDHPVVPQLNRLFGEHTFFLDSSGLSIVEPAEARRPGTQSAKVVNIANWSDDDRTQLKAHEPEPTDIVVVLGSKH
jgi:hypothetical protein